MSNKGNKDGSFRLEDLQINHAVTGDVTGFAAGVGTASKSDSTWKGSLGNSAYTVGDVVTALKKLGVLAQ